MRICKIDGLLVIFGWINSHLRICSMQWCKKYRLPSFIHIIRTFTANLISLRTVNYNLDECIIKLGSQMNLLYDCENKLHYHEYSLTFQLALCNQWLIPFFSSPTESNCSYKINKLTNNSHLNFHTLNKWPHRPVWWCSFLCII